MFELPDRRTSVTVPLVVGFHDKVNGVPALAARPSCGMLNGFGFAANANGVAQSARIVERRRYIIAAKGLYTSGIS